MNHQIETFAHNHFKNSTIFTSPQGIYVDLDYEPWEMQNILARIDLSQTAWENSNFSANGFKNYDSDGNSFWVGTLLIKAEEKNENDFLELADRWEKAEEIWEEDL